MTPKTNILLVEDDNQLRNLVASALRHDGHEVAVASDGFEALEQIRKNPFDLLISDIMMMGMDGIELALIASQERPEIKVILLSGYEEERARAVNLDFLVQGMLSKPFTLLEMKTVVSQTLKEVPALQKPQ